MRTGLQRHDGTKQPSVVHCNDVNRRPGRVRTGLQASSTGLLCTSTGLLCTTRASTAGRAVCTGIGMLAPKRLSEVHYMQPPSVQSIWCTGTGCCARL